MMGRSRGRIRQRAGVFPAAGLLALGLVAAFVAPALACIGNGGQMTFYPTSAPVGATVQVEGTKTLSAAPIDILFRFEAGSDVQVIVLKQTIADESGVFVVDVQVPPQATIPEGDGFKYYQLGAQQTRPDGSKDIPYFQTFQVVRASGPSTTVQQNPPPTTSGTSAPPTTRQTGSVSAPASVPSAAQPAGSPLQANDPLPMLSEGGAPVAPTAVAIPDAAASMAPVPDDGADNDQLNRDPLGIASGGTDANLWAGLDAAEAPTLLDPVRDAPDRGLPLGALVLGGGAAVLAAAAVALLVGRRRPLHARNAG